MTLMKQLLRDESGFVVSSELVLVATVLVIGMITGLTTLRDGVIQELVDVARAIGNIEQSYTYNGVTAHTSASNGSNYNDFRDYCEQAAANNGSGGPGCMRLTGAAVRPTNGESDNPLAAAP